MENKKVSEIFNNGLQFAMRRACYDKLPTKNNTSYRGSTDDQVYFQSISGKEVEFEVVRRMEFEPEGVFEATIVFTFKRTIKDGIDPEDLNFPEWLRSAPVQEINALCGNVFSVISLLLAQLTGVGSNTPLISPPMYTVKQHNQ